VGSAVDVPETPEVLVVARLLPPGRVGDHVAVLPQEGLNDLEDPRVANRPLHEAAPIEHLVAKRGGLLRQISSLIRRVLLENPLDIGTERRELVSDEDAVEEDIPVRLEALHRRRYGAGTESQVTG
jgi:hypothetical protein